MALFGDWCNCQKTDSGTKHLLKYTEKEGGRDAINAALPAVIQSHYDDAQRIEDDIEALGFKKASELLAERMPRSKKARSGELGEILATEVVEEELGYRVPIRRLRYKDGREMALRGDDFIGIGVDGEGKLKFAKGESKSRLNLSLATITEARGALARDAGRPTATSVLFVADRLMDGVGDDAALGRAIRNEVVARAVPMARIAHVLFTVSGNAAPPALADDLQAAEVGREHVTLHVHIPDHQDFIKASYEEALKLGDE